MIGQRLKRLRTMKGYSISELAEITGVSKSYLSYIERDLQKNPSLQILARLVTPLCTSIDYLLKDDSTLGDNEEIQLDEEWNTLIRRAIADGMSKADFLRYREVFRLTKKSLKDSVRTDEEKNMQVIILYMEQ